jgi:hypothetical protein
VVIVRLSLTQVTEEQLIALLAAESEGPAAGAGKRSGVVVQRRNYGLDEEDDEDDSDLL